MCRPPFWSARSNPDTSTQPSTEWTSQRKNINGGAESPAGAAAVKPNLLERRSQLAKAVPRTIACILQPHVLS